MAIEFLDKLTASVSKTAKQVSDNAKSLADKNRLYFVTKGLVKSDSDPTNPGKQIYRFIHK